MRYGVIYKITNSVTKLCYIGQTIQPLNNRFSGHIREALTYKSGNSKLPNAIRKYGSNVFTIELVVSNVPIDLLDDLETNIIAMEDSYNNGYNTLEYGKSAKGYKRSDSSKAKQSARMLGVNNNFYGKTHDTKTKELLKIKALEREHRLKGHKDGSKNPMARLANVYQHGTDILIAENICITEWCKGTKYLGRNLRQTAQTYSDPSYKFPAKSYKGIYAVYL